MNKAMVKAECCDRGKRRCRRRLTVFRGANVMRINDSGVSGAYPRGELDGFQGLQGADDARHDTQHACI